jgi:hypothetical protein
LHEYWREHLFLLIISHTYNMVTIGATRKPERA